MTYPDSLYLFYGYWQISVCTFAGIALLAIWHHITQRNALLQRDPGLLWLSIAVLVWGLAGWIDIAQAQQYQATDSTSAITFEGWKSMLSIFNSAFILLALPRFRHVPYMILPIVQSDSWRILVGLSFAFASLLTLLMLTGWIIPVKTNFIYAIDLAYAIFTLFFLGLMLWSSFEKRGLRLLAYLSVLSIVFTLLAQILKLMDSPFYTILLNGVFKSILITLFFALALSWIEELSQKQHHQEDEGGFLFFQQHKQGSKWINEIILRLPPLFPVQKISLTEKNYVLLLKFAQRKKEKPEAGWLEIQPKSNNAKIYDIRDYNEINRLLDALLAQQTTASEQDKKWLKENLFEYGRQRHLRLRFSAENIHLKNAD